MKYGLLTFRECINLGDEIQSLAARQFLPVVDYYIDRDHMQEFAGKEEIKLICNGWFMEKPQNWPPPDNIIPLFISMHINQGNDSQKYIINKGLKNYYRQFEPIGCRDHKTMELFQSIGVNAYYSGCLTLTLNNKFQERNNTIILADPFYKLGPVLEKRYMEELIPEKYKKDIIIFNQDINTSIPIEEKFIKAQDYLDSIAKAKLVITSRIHSALPSLALGTPVIFVNIGFKKKSIERIAPQIGMMNVVGKEYFPYSGFSRKDRMFRKFNIDKLFKKKFNIDWDNPPSNPYDIKPIADRLSNKVKAFIGS